MGVIYYFSGTGNGYTLAKELAAALQADLKSMAQYLRQPEEITADFIGLVAPVYCMNVPPVVEHFLATVRIKDNPYMFYVANMGATAGGSLGRAKDILAGRGLKLAAGCTVPVPDNSIVFPSPAATQAKMLERLPERISTIVYDVQARRENAGAFGNPTVWNLVNKAGWAFMDDIIDVKNRKLDPKKCIGCGTCAAVCPAGCITMQEGKPVFGKGCYSCFACAHWCPETAISLGFLKPGTNSKYTYPGLTAAELAAANKK
jgi:ferredoxin